jgi:hypothetical protein
MNEKKLNGNNAKITPAKYVNPLFENYVINDYRTSRYGGVYNRLEDDAEFCKKEVDDNKK